jgi:hypothetical protein
MLPASPTEAAPDPYAKPSTRGNLYSPASRSHNAVAGVSVRTPVAASTCANDSADFECSLGGARFAIYDNQFIVPSTS